VTKYFYDKADNPEKISYMNPLSANEEASVVIYGYDVLNRLATATNYAGTVSFSY
jgi:hypothetical protein